jgi:radical SAM superfamily enzyme YgiQ (UPF0313 family)
MIKKIIGLSFPENNTNLGLEPSILNVLPQGNNVEYHSKNKKFDDSEVDKYLCSVYISGMDEFKKWAMQHDTKKIVVGGYHPTMFPEEFLNFAEKIVMGPCDDLESTLSQTNILFEKSHYDTKLVGNARFVSGRILRTIQSEKGIVRVHGEIPNKGFSEKKSGLAEIITDRIIPGILSFKNVPRYDLYDIRNNQQVIPDKKLNDLATSINTSFGCPYKCDFCCTPVMFGPGLISKPIDHVKKEVDLIKTVLDKTDDGTKERFLFIRDENFTLQKDYRERLEVIAQTGTKIYLFASANTLREEVVNALADNNVYMVCLGLEDPTKEYAKNKKLDEAVRLLKNKGIYTYLSFIVDPTHLVGRGENGITGAEKGKDFYKLLQKRFEELKPEMVCGNFLMPFPGTPLWDDYYWMVNEKDFQHYDSKTPFLVKNNLVATKMKYFMFDVQWKYYTSDLYNNHIRKFDVGDQLYNRFVELKKEFDDLLGIMHLRP